MQLEAIFAVPYSNVMKCNLLYFLFSFFSGPLIFDFGRRAGTKNGAMYTKLHKVAQSCSKMYYITIHGVAINFALNGVAENW